MSALDSKVICMLCSNHTVKGSRYSIDKSGNRDNNATRLYNCLPFEWKSALSVRINTTVEHKELENVICRTCLKLLERRKRAVTNLTEVNNIIRGYLPKWLCETDFTSRPKLIALSDDEECESETFHHCDGPMMQSTPIKSVPSSSMKATKREQSESNEHSVKVL
jgi:hypothetical protein